MLRLLPLILVFCCSSYADELKRSVMTDQYWVEINGAISPDSNLFHGDSSAVGDRRDVTFRYQYGTLGLLVNWHQLEVDSELDQEAYKVKNSIFGAGLIFRFSPFGDNGGGFFGNSHLVTYLMLQTGRSDYHYFEGPDGGAKSEINADIVKASGFASGIDFYFPAVFGLWFSAGAGFETNSFSYKIETDPNGDGKVNIRQMFTYLRGGLAYSF